MAQKKTNEVESWLARPDPAIRMVLLYGPDRGLVAERARAFIAKAGLDPEDPFTSVRLDAGEIDGEPGRLVDEATTVAMFGTERLVWVRNAAAQKALSDAVKALLETDLSGAFVVIEAGDLKKGTALRAAVEGAARGMALPCYPDDGRNIDAVIDDVLGGSGLRIGLEARQALRANLGGDRLATRGELDKLAVYCLGQQEVSLDDVMLMTGDVAGVAVDDAVDAMLDGDRAGLDRAFGRLMASGTNPFVVLAAAGRQLQSLLALRAQMDADGKSASAAVASARPPVFFSRRRLVEQALQRRDQASLIRALERVQAAVLHTRRRPDLATAAARQALLALAAETPRRR